MSGILGVINLDGAPVDRKQLAQMTNYMAFRGPDHQDIWLKQQVGFGHTLLRTTFEAEREQGITTLDGQVWITADVRLDSREELIGKLAAKGRQLEAQVTDVELVLHAYHLWGEDALDHLMGDFAFGIWDERAQRLFCAHDHFGVVPFYYAKVKNCLIFSNTLNALRLHPAVSDTLNEQTIGDFLLVGYYPNLTTTTFADIQRLPPAHSLVWAGDALAIRRYYQLTEETNSVHYRRPAEYIQHFQSIFDQAVADRLRTAKAGTFLSGGMDSTSIAVTAQALLRATGKPFDFRAYTIVYEHLVTDQEGYYAGLVAEASAIPIEYLVAETYLQAPPLDNTRYRLPEPSLIPNQVAECEITARAAAYSRVLFTGFGGDPLLEPTSHQRTQLSTQGILNAVAAHIHCAIHTQRLPRLGVRSRLRRHLRSNTQPPLALPAWLQADFVARQQLHSQQTNGVAQISPQRDRHGMFTAPVWSNIFAASDPGMTGYPLRLRFPFFDLRLVQYVMAVPPTPWLENKQLLRVAMQTRLPKAIRQRPKTLLRGNPFHKLAVQRGVQSWMTELFATPALAPYVDSKRCLEMLQTSTALNAADYQQLMRVFPLAYWLHHNYHSIPAGADSAPQLLTQYT